MTTGTIDIEKVNITPGVSILSVLQHLNFRPWYAIAEFVDNSLQSFIDYRDPLEKLDEPGAQCEVDIELDRTDQGRIVV